MDTMITNRDIEHIFSDMATLYEMKGVQYKPRAYERAADGVRSLSEEVAEVYEKKGVDALKDIPGVGESIAGHIEEIITTGSFSEYEKMKKEMPVDIESLTAIEGIGPKRVRTLYDELGVENVDDLEKAVENKQIRQLDGFGEKTEANIREGIQFYREHHGRFLYGEIIDDVQRIEERVKEISGIGKVAVAGSIRRRRATIGDIDILATADDHAKAMEAFTNLTDVEKVFGMGETKTSVRLYGGIDADLRIVSDESWGAALVYFTGSKEHNVELRKVAQKKKWKLNEYGLFDENDERIAGRSEEELYDALDMAYIEPELRENSGEIAAAKEGALPILVGYDDIRGDLQMHTTHSDGSASIEEMARAAHERGHEYIVISDHTEALAMTGGLTPDELREQMKEIRATEEMLHEEGIGIRILAGSEVDIFKDGSLDMDEAVLKKLDVVGAAIHSHLGLSRDDQTTRMIRAIENPHVDIIYHPTTRVLNRRGPIDLDIDAVLEAAKRTGTILEIDAAPDRLDLSDKLIKRCVDAGVRMCIDTDAHHPDHLSFIEYGIAQARRGWATPDDIINTRGAEEMLSELKVS